MATLPLIIGAGSLIAKGLGSIFGHKAQKKQQADQNRANTNALNLQQKMSEDKRIANVNLANSMLSRVPQTTAGGGVTTNVALDPELVKQLQVERKYDFGSAMPTPGVGAGSAFLSGLFGDVANTLPYMVGSQDQSQQAVNSVPPRSNIVATPDLTMDELRKLGVLGHHGADVNGGGTGYAMGEEY